MKTHSHFYHTTLIIGLQIISLCTTKAQTNNNNKHQVTYKPVKVRRQKYFTAGFNVGMMGWSPSTTNITSGNNAFSRTINLGLGLISDVNNHSFLDITANTSMGINGGFLWFDKHKDACTTIQVEMQNNKACYSFNYPFKYTWKGDSSYKWVEEDKYIKYSIALQRSWCVSTSNLLSGKKYYYIRESFGQTFFHRDIGSTFSNVIKQGHAEDWTENGTGLKSVITSVNQNTYMLGTELGFKIFSPDNKHSLDVGVVWYMPFTNTYTEQYVFYKNNVSVGTSTTTFNGSTIMCNLRYSLNYHVKNKPVDSVAVKIKNEVVNSTNKINNRHVDVQKTMQAATDLVTASVWDDGLVDGDQISLYLNGQLVLENFTLTKAKQTVQLHLVAGTNYLVMHAVNLGSVPPNTAAMEIDDSSTKRHKIFTLTSDTQKSGAIEIIYKP